MNKVLSATLALLFALLISGASFAADPMSKMADTMAGAMGAAADTAKDMTGTGDKAKEGEAAKEGEPEPEPDCD
ncbi:hypothetical protein [Solemya velum gill symbiont]|uniref:hypothetical protein n=1 Tax=Solemya velum gill symbiont TaxID=2340 RepID=UPI00099798C7|nr:hypothetical protein [Solemya velum gill symbiont]OOY82301.1 hypothetical protein BOW12_06040 [Solemya velum gill symbiont]